MEANHSLAYLLLYAANIDTKIDSQEKSAIRAVTYSNEEWQKLLEEFEKDDEYTRIQKIEAILKANSTEEKRSKLIEQVKRVMKADDHFSMMERYLLKLMERY